MRRKCAMMFPLIHTLSCVLLWGWGFGWLRKTERRHHQTDAGCAYRRVSNHRTHLVGRTLEAPLDEQLLVQRVRRLVDLVRVAAVR